MSVHLTDEALMHSWNATPEPEVGEPAESAFFEEKGDRVFLMNKESPREFIFCEKAMTMEARR